MKVYMVTVRGVSKYPLEKRTYGVPCSSPGTAASKAIKRYIWDEGEVNPKRKRKITEYSLTIKLA